jgi:predicted nucleic acid-binding protein
VYYLETSALMKKYRIEKGTDLFVELFENKTDSETFITSYLTWVEVTSVATRLLRAGALTEDAYRALLANLAKDLEEAIELQSASDSVLSEAVQLAMSYALRAPDAIHLATALRARAAIPVEPFYSVASDARLNAACIDSSPLVLDPEADNAINILRAQRT